MTLALRPYRAWWSMLGLGGLLLLVGIAIGLHGAAGASSHPAGPLPVPTAVDRLLVLQAQTLAFGGAIDGGAMLYGAVAPSLPGPNTVHLSIRQADGREARGGRVRMVLSMPGMAMVPITATLAADGHGYSGRVVLPMFGSYHAQMVAATAEGRYTGAVTLTLPLALGNGGGNAGQQ